jgi:hypothetical protein
MGVAGLTPVEVNYLLTEPPVGRETEKRITFAKASPRALRMSEIARKAQ